MQLVELCLVEISPCNGKAPILIGSIYRHPGANIEEFTKHFDDLIIKLQNRYQLCILGGMNVDFLKYNHHTQTEEYLDMLHSNNISPIITKPTRITNYTVTLIDHIYTNKLNNKLNHLKTINHDILPSKLYTYGIHGTSFKWFKSYLCNCTQFVKIDEIESSMETITCRVP